jgi:hypothetical protein
MGDYLFGGPGDDELNGSSWAGLPEVVIAY